MMRRTGSLIIREDFRLKYGGGVLIGQINQIITRTTLYDYNGGGKTDIAVFREGVWYLLRSQQGFGAVQFGVSSDRPIPAAFVP